MGSLIGWLIARGIGERWARPLAYLLLAAGAASALGLAKCSYDRALITRHEAKQAAATARADRKADARAAEQRRADDARIAQERHQLERTQQNAPSNLDRRLAFHHCLRLQQQARSAGREPPSCN